MIQSYDLNENK